MIIIQPTNGRNIYFRINSIITGEVAGIEILNNTIKKKITGINSLYKSSLNDILWASTNTGIYSIDKELKIKHFDTSDGLPSNDVNAVVVDQDTLWAATTSGLAKIQLNKEKSNGNFSTFISGLSYELDGKNYEADIVYDSVKNIQIPARASMIDLQLSGLHFSSAGKINFEYFEHETFLPIKWLTWSNLIKSISNNISGKKDTLLINKDGHRYFGTHSPPGSYKIKVTAIAKDGVQSNFPDHMTLVILPYWHETIWFSLFILLMTIYIAWLFYRQWTATKRFQRAASELQLQAIKAQVNPHFIGNSINAIQQYFFPPNPVEASEYISTFTSLLRQTMHLSEVPFIHFEKEIDFISNYLYLVKLRFKDKFNFEISDTGKINPNTPFPAMLLQPIIENATIHGFAPEGVSELKINFNFIDNKIYCAIIDNGIGIEESKKIRKKIGEKRVSMGINLLKKKIESLNKMYKTDISLEIIDLSNISKESHGTKVIVKYSPRKIAAITEPDKS